MTGPEGRQEDETLMCVHCGAHWQVQRGSGRKRGFCMKCMGPTCGAQRCDHCIPFEKALELREAQDRFRRSIGR